jgi:UDP-2,4-diacetamido-2,4,6-trideoxy-beta-L-altropyranose hydrolase
MILIRCDSSTEIGTGHVYRCLVLAETLRAQGAQVQFICRQLPGNIYEKIRDQGFSIHFLKTKENEIAEIRSLAPRGSWLVIDHYEVDGLWETNFKNDFKIFVIDDLHNRQRHCNVLLDQNFHVVENPYKDLLSPGSIQLIGTKYSLLREEFRAAAKLIPDFAKRKKRILVFFGGGDSSNHSLRFIQAVKKVPSELEFDLLISKSNPHLETLRKESISSHIRLHIDPPNIAQLMLDSSIYFGSGGTVTWERMFLGLPGIVVSVAHNQTEIANGLAARGQQIFLGHADQVDFEQSLYPLAEYVAKVSWLEEVSKKNRKLVRAFPDSLLRAIFFSPDDQSDEFELKIGGMEDAQFLFDLRNDPLSRKMSISQDEVKWEEHIQWLSKALSQTGLRLYIPYLNGVACGQFRVSPTGEVSISLVSQLRGKGLAKELIAKASRLYLEEFPETKFLRARVKTANPASRKSFEQAGYIFEKKSESGGESFEDFIFSVQYVD